jgi:hypothetical protein
VFLLAGVAVACLVTEQLTVRYVHSGRDGRWFPWAVHGWALVHVLSVATVVCGGRTDPQEPMTKARRVTLMVLGAAYLLAVAMIALCW